MAAVQGDRASAMNDGAFRTIVFAVVGLVLVVMVLTQCIERANSQERHLHGVADVPTWYDQQCCQENDCYQVALGEVKWTEQGWFIVATQELIQFDDKRIRQSMDGTVHRCGIPNPYLPQIEWRTRCLYVSIGI